MKYFKKLEGKRIYLSPMNKDDIEIFTKWLNDSKVTDNINATTKLTTLETENNWFDNLKNSKDYVFSIVTQKEDKLIGNCSINKIDNISGTTELGIMIGEEENRSKGYGFETLRLLLDYCFNQLNMHNVCLRVLSINERAIKCYKKVGFKEVGRNREVRFHNGKWYDGVIMDILDREFNK